MSWFKRKAEEGVHPDLRDALLYLAEWEAVMALNLSNLQGSVAAQGDLIGKVKAEVDALKATQGSSADQDAVDALATTVDGNNAQLTALLPPST